MQIDNEMKKDQSSLESALINAYLDGRLTKQNRKKIESKIYKSSFLRDLMDQKRKEKEILLNLIPEKKLDINMLAQIKSEIFELNDKVLKDRTSNFSQKIWAWINRPFFKIKF